MSGNEITGIHNFFEENSSHQSQVAGSGHIVSNINPWIGAQASRVIPSSDTDSDKGNVRLPFQTPFGIGLSQFGLKQHINRSQSKNQQLNLNELMHVSTALQGRSGQGKFQQDGVIPDNLSLMQRGLANFGSQEGNSPRYGSGFPGSLEKPDVTASPVSFDFLGGHQQHSGQHPGMSQPHQMQQQGSNDMQWKQHLIAMQMQEIQRQQQLQQLHLGARQHNSYNQIYGGHGHGATDELPGMLSGMPIQNAVNYMPGELMGSQSKSPNSSHMFISGNMNWAQRNIPLMQGIPNGLIYSQDQGQSMHSMGFVPRQLDQSLHGTPVSGSMGSLNHYFQLQGMSNDSTSVDLMSKLGENHAERSSMQSSALNDFHSGQRPIPNQGYSGASFVAGRQGTQGKTLFGNALVQGTDDGAVSGSIHQSNHLTESVQVQEFQDGQVQTDWLGKSHDSITAQVAPSHTSTSLDPTEEKILFGVDDNANWDASLGGSSNRVAGTYLNGYPMQNNDCLNVFPSLQSGTWSALVQEALEVSSSDTGQQEEWSGLSLQKAEPQAGNHLVLLNDNGKQNAVRNTEKNLHDTLRSKPFPLLSDATARESCHSVPSSQQPIKYSYDQNERLETDHSIQSVQQLSKETNDAQFAQNYQPYNFIGNSLQERQRQLNTSNDAWVVQEHPQSMQHMDSAEMGSNSQGMQHSWIHQQKVPFYNMNSQLSNKLGSWGIESPSSSGSRNFKNDDNGDLNQYARSNDINTAMHIEMAHTRSLGKVDESKDSVPLSSLGGPESVKSENNNQKMSGEHSYVANFADFMNPNTFRSNTVMNQQLLNRQTVHPFKHVAGHMFVKDKEADQVNDQKQLNACPQDWDPSPGYSNKESGEAHGNAFSHLNTGHDTDDGRNERDDCLLARTDHLRLISNSQKFADQSVRKPFGSQRFQFHPMGNLEINMETTNQESHKSHSQGTAHPTIWGLKNQEKENFGNSQLVGHGASTNSIDMGKECYIDPKKNSTLEEMPHTDSFSGHNPTLPSFIATTAHFSREKKIGLSSQNVHMLFDKSDQSDDCSSAARQNISENNSSSCMPEGVSSDGPMRISHLQRIQANQLQGSGLKLAHPSQRQSAVGNPLIMHTPAEGTHQAWSSSPTSAASLPTIHETSRRENFDYKTVMSPQASKDTVHSNTKGNSLGMITNIRNQPVVQQQQQSISYASRQAQFDQSANQAFGSKVNADGHPKHLHPPLAHDPHDRSIANQTSQALFPGMPGKVPVSRFASFPDNGAPSTSQFYSQESGNSDMINAISDRRNASQLLQVVETVSANHSSAASVNSQQGHFSNMFNNAWRIAATQRPSGLQPQMFPSSLLQSLNPLQLLHQDDQRAKKGGNASSEVGTCSINSQQFTYGEENPLKGTKSEQNHSMVMDVHPRMTSASEVQEQESKNISNKSSAVSISSSVRLHQQDDKKGKHAENQREKAIFSTVSPSSIDVQTHNYSLLQQMQAMKGTDSDPSKLVSMRLKGTDSACRGSDAGSHPSDMKMLSFSSREIEERNGNASNHLTIGELASCRPTSSPGQNELQNGSLNGSVLNLERQLINPQMAPSWFDQYGNYKDGQTSGMSDSLGSSQRSTKAAAQHYFFSKTSEQVDSDAMMKRRGDSISENSSPTAVAADSHSSALLKVMVTDESLDPVRKKRKIASADLLSWQKEVTQSSQSLQSFSLAKMEWARATNRLIEKIEDDTEAMDDARSITRPKRRLILTTQLIQQLFPPVPTKFFFQDSVLSYEKVIYYLTKLTLGEACSLISALGSDSGLQLESTNMISEKHNTFKKREEFFSNIADNFILRLRKLQSNFLRLEGGSSVVDFRMECQDVERGSIINRFAKFHGRGPADVFEGSSASETAPRRSFPQRNVSLLPMPRNLPDGVICLSL